MSASRPSRRLLLGGALTAVGLLAAACGKEEKSPSGASASAGGAQSTVSVKHAQGTTEVPLKPKKVFVFDLGVLDTLDALGVEVAGVPKQNMPVPLKKYEGSKYTKIGSLKDPDFEKIASEKPDLIIASSRSSKSYGELSKIAPTLNLTPDQKAQERTFTEYATALGRIFGKEAEVKSKLEDIAAQAKAVKGAAGSGETLFAMVSGGEVNAYGQDSRFGYVFQTLGLTPVSGITNADRHGQAVSFEFVKEKNPARIYVLDRDETSGKSENGNAAKATLDNELVKSTDAAKNGKITYVDAASWYLVDFGLGNLPRMIADIKKGL